MSSLISAHPDIPRNILFGAIVREAQRGVACGPQRIITVGEGEPSDEPLAIGPSDLAYEVVRQDGNAGGHIIYLAEHMSRFEQSLVEVFKVGPAEARATRDRAAEAIQRLQSLVSSRCEGGSNGLAFDQNIKYIAWRRAVTIDTDAANSDAASYSSVLDVAAYYIKSSYPPRDWYTSRGAALGLLFGVSRPNPHAKVVYPLLKAKAADQIKALGVFESLIVHEDGLVPEGVRSNYILVTKEGDVLSSSDDDILVGTTLLAVRNQCRALGIPIVSRRLTIADVVSAEAMAMLGTSVNVLPVSTLLLAHDDSASPIVAAIRDKFRPKQLGGGAQEESHAEAHYFEFASCSNCIIRRLNEAYVVSTFH